MKWCNCCKKFIDLDSAKYIGKQQGDDYSADLYNCPCGDTLAIKVYDRPPKDMGELIDRIIDCCDSILGFKR
jgi:hypothetical protein